MEPRDYITVFSGTMNICFKIKFIGQLVNVRLCKTIINSLCEITPWPVFVDESIFVFAYWFYAKRTKMLIAVFAHVFKYNILVDI